MLILKGILIFDILFQKLLSISYFCDSNKSIPTTIIKGMNLFGSLLV
jgi:hypothetical protein